MSDSISEVLREFSKSEESRHAIVLDLFYGGEKGSQLAPYLKELTKCLFDNNTETRLFAVRLLVRADDRSDTIAEALRACSSSHDRMTSVACHAALAVLHLEGLSREVLFDYLCRADLDDELTALVFQAVSEAGGCSDAERNVLVELLRSHDPLKSLWASQALERLLGADSLSLFAQEVHSASPMGKSNSFLRLAKSHLPIEHLLPELIAGLHDSDVDVRYSAILAVDRAATVMNAACLQADVLRLLDDSSEPVRIAAAWLAAKVVPQQEKVFTVLQAGLQSSRGVIREQAIAALGRLCRSHTAARDQLFTCIYEGEDSSEAADALAEQGEWIVDEVVRRVVKGPREHRWDLLLIISIMGTKAREAKETLADWLLNGQARKWQEAHEIEDLLCSSLATMVEKGETRFVKPFVERVLDADTSETIKSQTILGLVAIGDRSGKVKRALVSCFEDRCDSVQVAARSAFDKLFGNS